MSEKKEGWYILSYAGKESAHFVTLPEPTRGPPAMTGCGRILLPADTSAIEPWLATNPQHISEIRQCKKCQAAIAIRDGRKPMEELDVSAPRPEARAKRKRPAKKATRRAR